MIFLWSLSDSKYFQVSRTLLSILATLNNAVSLDGLHSSSYFQAIQSLYQSFGDCTKSVIFNWYHSHFHVPQFFQFPNKVQVLILLLVFFQFYSVVSREIKFHSSASSPSFFFFVAFFCLLLSLVAWLRLELFTPSRVFFYLSVSR